MSAQTKGQTWEDDETLCMLTLWAEPEVQAELKSKVLARRVAAAGYPLRDGEACRDKVNRLRRSYRQYRDETRKSGSGTEELPIWYSILDAVDGDKPKTCPLSTLDTGNLTDSCSLSSSTSSSNSEREWKLNWRKLKVRARSDSQCSSNSGVKLRTAAAQRSRDKRFIPPTRNGPINTTSEKRVCIRVCIGVWLWVSKACFSPVSNSEKCDKHTQWGFRECLHQAPDNAIVSISATQ